MLAKGRYSNKGRDDLRLALLHGVDELELALGNLDDLFDETSANLLLQLVNPTVTG